MEIGGCASYTQERGSRNVAIANVTPRSKGKEEAKWTDQTTRYAEGTKDTIVREMIAYAADGVTPICTGQVIRARREQNV